MPQNIEIIPISKIIDAGKDQRFLIIRVTGIILCVGLLFLPYYILLSLPGVLFVTVCSYLGILCVNVQKPNLIGRPNQENDQLAIKKIMFLSIFINYFIWQDSYGL
jgi:hypothetical protein